MKEIIENINLIVWCLFICFIVSDFIFSRWEDYRRKASNCYFAIQMFINYYCKLTEEEKKVVERLAWIWKDEKNRET